MSRPKHRRLYNRYDLISLTGAIWLSMLPAIGQQHIALGGLWLVAFATSRTSAVANLEYQSALCGLAPNTSLSKLQLVRLAAFAFIAAMSFVVLRSQDWNGWEIAVWLSVSFVVSDFLLRIFLFLNAAPQSQENE